MGPAVRPGQPHPTQNIIGPPAANVALPGHVIVHDRRSIAITCNSLIDFLRALYEAGMRYVTAVIEVAGQRLVVDAVIYRRPDKRSGRARYLLYPLQPAQSLLRNMLARWRGGASPGAKRPMPVLIHSVTPKLR